MTIKIQDINTIQEAAQEFIQHIGDARVFAFYGKMGAGKTTFVKAICEALGCQDVITSPTFAIVNEYTISFWPLAFSQMPTANSQQPTAIYHFDFYRIKKLEEVYDMGYEEYFYSGALCFIEWPELVEEILPDDAVRVSITEQEDGSRVVSF